MTDQLETFLRSAFEQRLGDRDPTAADRLLAIDYHPRRRRRRIVLPAVGSISLAGIAAGAALLLGLGTDVAPAFAHWTAAPTLAQAHETASAIAECRSTEGLVGNPVLVDTRGPFTAAVWDTSGTEGQMSCIDAPSLHSSGGASQSDFTQVGTTGIQRSTSEVIFTDHRGGQQARATILYGRVGTAVHGVKVRLSDGTIVTATVSHGYYLAWWPGKVTGTTATVTTATGVRAVAVPPVDTFKGPGAYKPTTAGQTTTSTTVPVGAAPVAAAPVHSDATQTAKALQKCRDTEDVEGPPEVVDTRGPYTAAVWNTGRVTGQMSCVTGPELNGGGGSSQGDFSKVGPTGIQRSIMHVSFAASSTQPASQVTALYGRAGSDVTGVEVHLSNGTSVSGTVDHGFYVAWWSGKAQGTTATVMTTGSPETVTVPPVDSYDGQ